MHTIRNALAALLPLPCILLAAAPPRVERWDAARSPWRVPPVWRGETVGLECAMPGADLDGAVASFLWQTNGMAGWWSAPAAATNGAVSAVWMPAMDCGAAEYRFFLRAETAGGVAYRANGTLAVLGSPGEDPGVLAPPFPTLDLSAVEVLNAPWATPGDVDEAIRAAQIAGADLSAYATTGALESARRDLGILIGDAYGAAEGALRSAAGAQQTADDARRTADAALARRATVVPLAPGWRVVAGLSADPSALAHLRGEVEAAGGTYSGVLSVVSGAYGPAGYLDGVYSCAALHRDGDVLYFTGGDFAIVPADAATLGLPAAYIEAYGEYETRVYAVLDSGPLGAVVDGRAETPIALNSDLAALAGDAGAAVAELAAIRAAADEIELPEDPTAAELGAAFRDLLLCIRNPVRARAALRARPAPETDR